MMGWNSFKYAQSMSKKYTHPDVDVSILSIIYTCFFHLCMCTINQAMFQLFVLKVED